LTYERLAGVAQLVGVYALAPGFMPTPMTEGVSSAVREELVARQALPIELVPGDLSEMFVFLANTRCVTGQLLFADRGLSL
jgi:NAD(P)-dependent dehydrogenase (short-subunit alcohol dehydrogenase family)